MSSIFQFIYRVSLGFALMTTMSFCGAETDSKFPLVTDSNETTNVADASETNPPLPDSLPKGSTTSLSLMINEFLADPPAGVDVNNNGSASPTDDEFVEIVNFGSSTADLTQVQLTDAYGFGVGQARYMFAQGSTLEPGAAIVVWGADAALALNNSGDTIYLTRLGGETLDVVSYGSEGGNNQSINRAIDGDPQAGWVLHSTLAGGLSYSPGTKSDGSPFQSGPIDPDTCAVGPDDARVLEAFQQHKSYFYATIAGQVTQKLSDDTSGARHQRFKIKMKNGHTLMIVHNIDEAPRVPITLKGCIKVKGEYIYNNSGGLLHWTHAPKGWILFNGVRYE